MEFAALAFCRLTDPHDPEDHLTVAAIHRWESCAKTDSPEGRLSRSHIYPNARIQSALKFIATCSSFLQDNNQAWTLYCGFQI